MMLISDVGFRSSKIGVIKTISVIGANKINIIGVKL